MTNTVRRITAVIVTTPDGGAYDRALDQAALVLDTRGRLALRQAPSARARVVRL